MVVVAVMMVSIVVMVEVNIRVRVGKPDLDKRWIKRKNMAFHKY